MQRKTDATGQKVEYTYDSFDRVSEINRYPAPGTTVDPCQRTKLYYDYNGVVQYFAENTWGRLAIAEWGGTGCPGGTKFQEMYSYTPSGQVTKKRLRATRVAALQERSADLDLAYSYDTAGRLSTMKYPDTSYEDPPASAPRLVAGALLTYGYSTLGQLVTLTGAPTGVSATEYNPAGQMTRLVYGTTTELRTYNERLQLSGISWSSGQSVQYEYWTAGDHSDNNGQIREEVASGEQITYQYDSLRRLTAASSTRPWSETYTYDGFGNRTGAGVPITAATNRVSRTSTTTTGM